MSVKKTTEEFISEALEVHADAYEYSLVDYKHTHAKVVIFCKKCQKTFLQKPSAHLSGNGCRDCGVKKSAYAHRLTKEVFITKADEAHKGIYDYSLVKYKNSSTKVTIICNSCKNVFQQNPHNHLNGQGCPKCANYGFNVGKPAILYYLKICDSYYKIGITNRTVEERFTNEELTLIKVLKTWEYTNGAECLAKEQEILQEFSEFRHTGQALLTNGNTEIFTRDVLELDR